MKLTATFFGILYMVMLIFAYVPFFYNLIGMFFSFLLSLLLVFPWILIFMEIWGDFK